MEKCTPYYRQLLVASTSHLAGLSVGTLVAYPIVLLQQLPADPNMAMDLDTSSWIGSVYGLAGILSIFMTPLMQWKGRKFAFIISSLIIISGWILIIIAKNAAIVIIGASFHGLGSNSIVIVSLVTVSEMINPKSRSLAMLLFGIFQAAGLIIVTTAGHFLNYKTVGIVMCVPITIALLMSLMWPDSPFWLAIKGDFEKCERIFLWLRGNSEDSKKEVDELIAAQKEVLKEVGVKVRIERQKVIKQFLEKVTRKDFYLPMTYVLLLIMTFYGSGIYVTFIYGIQMIESMTGATNSLSHVVLLDGTIAISSIISIILEKHCRNKQIFLFGGASSVIFTLLLCIVTYLNSAGMLQKGSMLFLYCFLGSIMSNISGLSFAIFSVSTELIPVKHRGLGGAIFLITVCTLHTISVKTAPYLFEQINVWGAYALYFVLAAVGYFLIWKYVPETKYKTLQEIEDYYNRGDFKNTPKDDLTINVPILASE